MGPKQPHDGDNGVVPVQSTLQERLSPGHVPAKAFLAWGNGKFLGMLVLSVVGCGLRKQSPTKGEGHKERASGQCKAQGLPTEAEVIGTGELLGPEGEGGGSCRLGSGTTGSAAEAAASPSLMHLFYFPCGDQRSSNEEQLCSVCCPSLAEVGGGHCNVPQV